MSSTRRLGSLLALDARLGNNFASFVRRNSVRLGPQLTTSERHISIVGTLNVNSVRKSSSRRLRKESTSS